jgi:hypothetical protein
VFILRYFVRVLLVRLAPLGSSALLPRPIIWDYTSLITSKNNNVNVNVENLLNS